jgi:predicted metal-dependent HD superfamily phosphohydrolase
LAALAEIEGEELLLLRVAALYHDIGYLEQYARHEPIGARIAAETLPGFGFSSDQVGIVREIIMATQMPQSPHNFLEKLMCDADLDSLGRVDYLATSHALRSELAMHGVSIPCREWYKRQHGFLSGHTYFTDVARSLRRAGKLGNIAELERRLDGLA